MSIATLVVFSFIVFGFSASRYIAATTEPQRRSRLAWGVFLTVTASGTTLTAVVGGEPIAGQILKILEYFFGMLLILLSLALA